MTRPSAPVFARSSGRSALLLLLVLAWLAWSNPACADRAEPDHVVRIGFSGPLSGASEEFGKSLANAAELAVIELNRQQLRINGRRVQFRLLRMNDRNDVATAVDVARQLIDAGVVGVIGTLYSATSQAVLGIYAAAGIPMITPAASASALATQGSSSFFRMIVRDDEIAAYVGEHAVRSLKLQRFALVNNRSLFGTSLTTAFRHQVTVLGGEVATHAVIDFTTDLRALVRDLKSKGVQAIFFGGYMALAGALAQAIKAEEADIRLILASSGAVGPTFLATARAAAEGTLAAESGVPASHMPGWPRFVEHYQRRFESGLFSFTPFAYDAVQVLVAAMRLADSADPRRVTMALRKIRFLGLTGPVSFDARGNQRHSAYTLFQVREHRWEPLKVVAHPRVVAPSAHRIPRLPSLADDAVSSSFAVVRNSRRELFLAGTGPPPLSPAPKD